MADMRWYKANWAYRGGSWPEPITAGGIIRATVEQAAQLNRCSPGILVEFDPDAKAAPAPEPARASAPAAPEHRAAPVAPVQTADPLVRRGPGRPPKNAPTGGGR